MCQNKLFSLSFIVIINKIADTLKAINTEHGHLYIKVEA